MKKMQLICVIGMVFSFGAAIHASTRYIVLYYSAKSLETMETQDVVTPKIDELLTGQELRELILDELNHRQKYGDSLRNIFLDMLAKQKTYILVEVVLWIMISSIFIMLVTFIRRAEGGISITNTDT